MSLIPLDIPPGMYQNGTEYEQSNRWRDGSLVRWVEGTMKPVGGWLTFTQDALSAPARGLHVWKDNSANINIAAGNYNTLYYISSTGQVNDITPTGLAEGNLNAALNNGFGGYTFGSSAYGTQREAASSYQPATTWSLDNWGENLVACSTSDGKLYEWALNPAVPAAQIANSPENNQAMLVTEERFIFALGADGDPRKVAWCDRENNTDWTATDINEAGDILLQTSGAIQGGVRVRGRALIITDVDAHIATYQGSPYVYGFQRVGTACGTNAPKSIISVDNIAFWMGTNGFYVFDGSEPKELNCDVRGRVFKNINRGQITQVYGVHLSQFSEVWWFYASEGSIDNDSYVSFNYKDSTWSFGDLGRSAAVGFGTQRYPIFACNGGNLHYHEYGNNHNGYDCFIESAPISLGNGDQVMKVTKVIPDEINQGDVELTFKTRFYPNGEETSHGAYSMTNPTSVRFTGRQFRMRIDATPNKRWGVGTMRVEAMAGGGR